MTVAMFATACCLCRFSELGDYYRLPGKLPAFPTRNHNLERGASSWRALFSLDTVDFSFHLHTALDLLSLLASFLHSENSFCKVMKNR